LAGGEAAVERATRRVIRAGVVIAERQLAVAGVFRNVGFDGTVHGVGGRSGGGRIALAIQILATVIGAGFRLSDARVGRGGRGVGRRLRSGSWRSGLLGSGSTTGEVNADQSTDPDEGSNDDQDDATHWVCLLKAEY